MHSPLPDASALEAGIIEDERPSRLSRVQDNVRQLLRASVVSPVRSSFAGRHVSHQPTVEEDPQHEDIEGAALAAETVLTPPPESSGEDENEQCHGVLFPPLSYTAHQSTLYNTRAVAALNHPDLSDPSLAVLLHQKTAERQQRAWKRSRNRKLRYANGEQSSASLWILCLAAGLLLAGIVATYLAIATSSTGLSTTFHVLFVLGILAATVIFAHTIVRLCFFVPTLPPSPRVYVVSQQQTKPGRHFVRHRRRRHHHHHHQPHRHHQPMPQPSETVDFIPPTPIPVHVADDASVRPDSREAHPTSGVARASQAWDKEAPILANPPPAYGRWRGSVRANPDLLHWQAVPSPVDPDTPALPSPTYEEAMNVEHSTGPPSYVTRDSPARRREMQEARPQIARAQTAERVGRPEMVEAKGAGAGGGNV
ncbi:hypothetical protein BAUCODRAFT_154420 [Baudoinia panamericana UAMH 10762]|uniref:Uncharacterized protein n=1 Tax=Baudoinia panamericana (strain UAMH 10762) TaxID=717646 RepID=M2NH55_BAUPA|nr:uncharacterized protein BAUCODRAFT_154420 [Baudoinia panamericana UAMH 10762]EMC98664.1 hypothetical protein BAUCODRAFT_154420 [Baudoinia panamericana UAMH 10762]